MTDSSWLKEINKISGWGNLSPPTKKMNPKAYSNKSNQSLATPKWFIEQLQLKAGIKFEVDVCAENKEVACAPNFFSPEEDGLKQNWDNHLIRWCNPEWNNILPWVEKATEYIRGETWFLVPAKTETQWFRFLFKNSQDIIFIYPRLNYWDGKKLLSNINVGSVLFRITENRSGRPNVVCEKFEKPKDAKR